MATITTDRPYQSLSLTELGRVIANDWRPVNYAAKPYLDAMYDLYSIDDDYFQEDGRMIVAYFLSNASAWRGDVARSVKAELKARLK